MNKKLLGVFALVLLSFVGASGQQASSNDDAAQKLIEAAIHDSWALKPGIDRAAVEKTWVEDGGLQFRTQTRYLYRRCNLIHIDIEFSGAKQDAEFSPADKVTKVSKLYLDYPAYD